MQEINHSITYVTQLAPFDPWCTLFRPAQDAA